jgi:hypothetical protein
MNTYYQIYFAYMHINGRLPEWRWRAVVHGGSASWRQTGRRAVSALMEPRDGAAEIPACGK